MSDLTFQFFDSTPLIDGELELHCTDRRPADQSRNLVPVYLFDIRVAGTRVGSIQLRVGNTRELELYGGHFGYAVDPGHRGHAYAARACRLLLPLARRHGLTTLWITCNPDNIASRRTCERLGAELVEIISLPPDNDMHVRGDREKCRYRLCLL
jgi:tagatose 1,6-diphosphate aldolase